MRRSLSSPARHCTLRSQIRSLLSYNIKYTRAGVIIVVTMASIFRKKCECLRGRMLARVGSRTFLFLYGLGFCAIPMDSSSQSVESVQIPCNVRVPVCARYALLQRATRYILAVAQGRASKACRRVRAYSPGPINTGGGGALLSSSPSMSCFLARLEKSRLSFLSCTQNLSVKSFHVMFRTIFSSHRSCSRSSMARSAPRARGSSCAVATGSRCRRFAAWALSM